MKLLVYVPLLTPRIKYIFNFIFTDILHTQVGFSSNLQEYNESDLPKISYASRPVKDELFFKQDEFLLGHSIKPPTIRTSIYGDMIVPFAVEGGILPFDIFAASFYFVSRFEEYLPFEADENGNFPAEQSLQSKLKLLEFPVIDGWAMLLKNILLKQYPGLHFGKKKFEITPLICLYPSTAGSSFNLFKQVFTHFGSLLKFKKQVRTQPGKLSNLQLFLVGQHTQHNLNAVYFYRPALEVDSVTDRQLVFPNSYLHLIKHGLQKDYRMGYLNKPGFRAGTCTPFYWYDLQLEKMTHLRIHPVPVNDLILKQSRTFDKDKIHDQWGTMINHVRKLEGSFYMVWHKDTLPEYGKGKAGRQLYAQLLADFSNFAP
ncbi:DUF7033 domain-containing protein [Pedobacter antarcticus]|uniref:DUF7033 domain-containing protein n=1 Tax=Pedobacter antarcticus TaxID=34086 RepID=UPI000888EDCE|nr:hypothetical protein [Pedobacter antarcticus]SDM19246.1 hypothetical protein SAMN04488084_104241 [Pedobacter antarcticus]